MASGKEWVNKIGKSASHNEQISRELRINFRTKFYNLLINFFYFPKGNISYVPQVWLYVTKISLYYLHQVARLKKKIDK